MPNMVPGGLPEHLQTKWLDARKTCSQTDSFNILLLSYPLNSITACCNTHRAKAGDPLKLEHPGKSHADLGGLEPTSKQAWFRQISPKTLRACPHGYRASPLMIFVFGRQKILWFPEISASIQIHWKWSGHHTTALKQKRVPSCYHRFTKVPSWLSIQIHWGSIFTFSHYWTRSRILYSPLQIAISAWRECQKNKISEFLSRSTDPGTEVEMVRGSNMKMPLENIPCTVDITTVFHNFETLIEMYEIKTWLKNGIYIKQLATCSDGGWNIRAHSH